MGELKTETSYWNAVWEQGDNVLPARCGEFSRHEYMDSLLHAFFVAQFASHFGASGVQGKVLLEAGCGGSRWLPYFATCHCLRVKGVDYSRQGCDLARSIAAKAGVDADIAEMDLFQPDGRFHAVADIVYSSGLVEHFDPLDDVLRQLRYFLRPGGLLVTIVPNLQGVNGALGNLLNPDVMAMHVVVTPPALQEAHTRCGLTPLAMGYLGTINLPTMSACYTQWAHRRWFPYFSRLMSLPTNVCWLASKAGVPSVPSRVFSPFLYCVATTDSDD